MTVTPGYFDLSEEQRRFRQLLQQYPYLLKYWRFEKRECDLPAIHEAMPSMSHGERILAQFLLGVWLGENSNQFDLFEAIKTLDKDALATIEQWMADPFFP